MPGLPVTALPAVAAPGVAAGFFALPTGILAALNAINKYIYRSNDVIVDCFEHVVIGCPMLSVVKEVLHELPRVLDVVAAGAAWEETRLKLPKHRALISYSNLATLLKW